MAQRVQVQLVDDLTGQKAQETIRFGIDGAKYEIDLTTENAARLRAALSVYVNGGRKASNSRQGQSGQAGLSATRNREKLQEIRKWAQENGLNPNVRGRVSYAILDAYTKAHA
ncbi:Lsr2 family protein [Arthrobacter flavus]|uniref:Lsr2 family protein n=1 Tax=Arthrobacter flavus TaxID=95172 RepID=A0ABW4Q7N9_9MICC